ncbi:hypothetical protein N181_28220 [Sinorhizobium fredii USDA 205]|uniref:Capsule polysaccharide biosynthesis protein n=1 Tax=Rhizobium fredii TaxID=380 RepID=A0A844AGS3_RHIFR|nr:hypothetical protein [Sinorhizobium fredii]ASY71959.1 hypothetical protein SF83666_b53100 [Sinorhizobium fredii CCBAU 83666]KSV81166.1 hypothetical protein N181_28220 [Sinorhizobium fredii USDA 205]MQX12384.1 hypothetical protein [Sinorhizobium fredii]GEC34754.1 hypothetical protein EFR01_49250 [Sinorhizobium fredii]GLS08090.1 hypothetical protein GCM10007864_17190 [Sinorhizobium fredii]
MKVLIQCGDLLENQHRILPLAESLRAAGADPIILHYKPSVGAFFKARGVKILHLDAYRARIKKGEVSKAALGDAFWNDEAYSIYGIKHELLRAAPADRRRDLYMLRRDGLALTRLVDDQQIDSLIVWNGVTGHVANAMRIIGNRRKITGGYLERGYLRDSVFFDRDGTNGASSLACGTANIYDSADVSSSVKALGDFVSSTLLNFADTPASGRKQIFVPLQVQQDSNILLYSPSIKTMRQLVLDAINLAQALGQEWDVIVRDHPEETQSGLNIPFGDRVWRDNSSTLEERISSSHIVFTVNSTVGLTAALAGKVVICSGDGIYCGEPFVINKTNMMRDQLVDRVRSALRDGPDSEELTRYMCLLLDRHQLFDSEQFLGAGYSTQALSRFAGHSPSPKAEANLLKRIQQQVRAAHERYPEGIAVDFQLSRTDTLSLTYRKSAERVTANWVMQALEKNFPGIAFRRSLPDEPVNPASSVCVCSANIATFGKLHNGYAAVLDQYGEPHLRFYD